MCVQKCSASLDYRAVQIHEQCERNEEKGKKGGEKNTESYEKSSKLGINSASACVLKAGLDVSLTSKNRKEPEVQQKLQGALDFITPSQAH